MAGAVGFRSRLEQRNAVLRTLALEAALVEIARAFELRGVRFLVLKGVAFARWLYDEPRARTYGDVDVLVAPDGFAEAESALVGVGCARLMASVPAHTRAGHHERWMFPGWAGAVIELHRTLWGVRSPPVRVWERLSENARPIEVGGVEVSVPSQPGGALIVGLHAAQHGVRDGRHMEDLRRALAKVDESSWRAAAALAGELGALEQFAWGLRLDPVGCAMADRLGLPTRASRLVRLLASTPPDVAAGIEELVSTRGLGARARLVAAEVFPPPASMRVWRPRARRGRWGLALLYVWRPVWLILMLPRAGWAWVRAAVMR